MSVQNPKVGLVKVPVSDFDRARHFYRDVLGLKEDFAEKQFSWAQFDAGTIPLCIYVPGAGGGKRPPGGESGIHLFVDNAAEFREQIIQRQGRSSELHKSADGCPNFTVSDPDNNEIVILQPGP